MPWFRVCQWARLLASAQNVGKHSGACGRLGKGSSGPWRLVPPHTPAEVGAPPRPKPWVGNRCPAQQHIPHGGGSHKAVILLFPSVMLMAPDPLQMKMLGKRKMDRGIGASILDAPTPLSFP